MNPRIGIAALALLASGVAAAQTAAWPQVALPKGAQAFEVGDQLNVNGMPMQLRGFVSTTPLADNAAWFRDSLGKPLVENRLGVKLVLGRMQGEHYVTVQLEALPGGGTRGLVAVSRLPSPQNVHAASDGVAEKWLSRLPAGSRIETLVGAQDGAKLSRYLVFSNGLDEGANAQRLRDLMRDQGFALERETAPDPHADGSMPVNVANGRTLFFRSAQGHEAVAVVVRVAPGRTIVALNTVASVEAFK